jgi:hypothetical protein
MQHAKQKITSNGSSFLVILSVITAVIGYGSLYAPPASAEGVQCDAENTVTANVVALDQPIMFNRLGAQNVNYMMYALERDVINIDSGKPLTKGGAKVPGQVSLRPDKRPRPLVLRVAAGQCLKVNLTNLLKEIANPFNGPAGVAGNAPSSSTRIASARTSASTQAPCSITARAVPIPITPRPRTPTWSTAADSRSAAKPVAATSVSACSVWSTCSPRARVSTVAR